MSSTAGSRTARVVETRSSASSGFRRYGTTAQVKDWKPWISQRAINLRERTFHNRYLAVLPPNLSCLTTTSRQQFSSSTHSRRKVNRYRISFHSPTGVRDTVTEYSMLHPREREIRLGPITCGSAEEGHRSANAIGGIGPSQIKRRIGAWRRVVVVGPQTASDSYLPYPPKVVLTVM